MFMYNCLNIFLKLFDDEILIWHVLIYIIGGQ